MDSCFIAYRTTDQQVQQSPEMVPEKYPFTKQAIATYLDWQVRLSQSLQIFACSGKQRNKNYACTSTISNDNQDLCFRNWNYRISNIYQETNSVFWHALKHIECTLRHPRLRTRTIRPLVLSKYRFPYNTTRKSAAVYECSPIIAWEAISHHMYSMPKMQLFQTKLA